MEGEWSVCKTKFPFRSGYGIYNKKIGIIMDFGISRLHAKYLCGKMNRKKKKEVE
jgi:hypothetical protein